MSEEYIEDQYITEQNDPCTVEKITENDYTIPEKEEKIEFDETFENVRATIEDFVQYDKDMEKKMLDSLRKGKLK